MERTHTVLDTDWGYMTAAWSDNGLWELGFPAKTKPENISKAVSNQITFWSDELRLELNAYFRGFQICFGVPLDFSGYTEFQTTVLKYAKNIEYGHTTTYGEVAKEIGSPKAIRAVGGALGSNRTPIIIPCHRVIGANENLTGFSGGLELKKALLLLESC